MGFRKVTYDNKPYRVYKIKYKDTCRLFVVDEDDGHKVREYKTWHIISNGYVSHSYYVDKKEKVLYLHNLIMNRLNFPGKGATETVDHINRIGTDNRKENLQICSQSQQNFNQKRKIRTAKLPDNCGFTWEDVPKTVWLRKQTKKDGPVFFVTIQNVPEIGTIKWFSTASKSVSLKFKLEHTKKYLRELKEENPSIFKNRKIDTGNYNKEMIDLMESYNAILNLSG